jgi:hypothetical protein
LPDAQCDRRSGALGLPPPWARHRPVARFRLARQHRLFGSARDSGQRRAGAARGCWLERAVP